MPKPARKRLLGFKLTYGGETQEILLTKKGKIFHAHSVKVKLCEQFAKARDEQKDKQQKLVEDFQVQEQIKTYIPDLDAIFGALSKDFEDQLFNNDDWATI